MRSWVVSRVSRACDLVLGTFRSSSEAPSDLLERPTGKTSTVGGSSFVCSGLHSDGMKSSSSSSSLLAPAGAVGASVACASGTPSEKSAVSSLLHQAEKRLRRSSPEASASSDLREPADAAEPSQPSDDDGEPLDWSYTQRGLVTQAEVTHQGVTATVEVFPLDPDRRFYWAMTMRTSVANTWDKMFKRGLKDKWKLDSGATGMGAEFWVCDSIGIPVAQGCCGCDPSEKVRELLLYNKNRMFGHFFADFETFIKRKGRCFRCGVFCDASLDLICMSLKAVFPHRRRDCAVLGPPCQPFSPLNCVNKKQGASSHPLFNVIFPGGGTIVGYGGTSCLDYLAVHLPLTAIIEEVQSFADVDAVEGKCWLREFIEMAKTIKCPFTGLFYYVAIDVFNEVPGKWMNIRRPRILECYNSRSVSTSSFKVR